MLGFEVRRAGSEKRRGCRLGEELQAGTQKNELDPSKERLKPQPAVVASDLDAMGIQLSHGVKCRHQEIGKLKEFPGKVEELQIQI